MSINSFLGRNKNHITAGLEGLATGATAGAVGGPIGVLVGGAAGIAGGEVAASVNSGSAPIVGDNTPP
jgi:hypothetical protein